ncbi:MAG TPA: dihydrodipicolinate synthase family protein [Acidimicrobiales bacterium]|nr:dihydrodipicolinate synthase family protein [Acidimicrobiales bacterium]
MTGSGVDRGREAAGVFVISITPFDAEGRLDETGLRAHLRRMAEAGIGVYVGGGGSGEGYTLDPGEAHRVVEVAVEEIGHLVPVRAMGVEPRTSAEMVTYINAAAGAGVGAAQVYSLDPGHGHRPTDAEIRRYFLDVLDGIGIPAVLSSHQSVGYRLAPKLLSDLIQRFDVIGVNCSQPDLGYLADVVDVVEGRAQVHVGGPHQALAALALGGHGYLSSEANLAPRLAAAVVERHAAGDLAGCLDAYGRVLRLSSGLYGRGGIRATKSVLNRLGLPGGVPRPPQLPVEGAELDECMDLVRALDLGRFEGWS